MMMNNVTWPFFIIVPGVLLFLIALAVDESTGSVLAIVGSVITMTGTLLLYQNSTGHWTSWSYAWALIAPTSVGLGQWLYGFLKDKAESVSEAKQIITIGLTIFGIGFFFFELVLGITGFGLGRLGWPLILIAVGLFLLMQN